MMTNSPHWPLHLKHNFTLKWKPISIWEISKGKKETKCWEKKSNTPGRNNFPRFFIIIAILPNNSSIITRKLSHDAHWKRTVVRRTSTRKILTAPRTILSAVKIMTQLFTAITCNLIFFEFEISSTTWTPLPPRGSTNYSAARYIGLQLGEPGVDCELLPMMW